MTPNNALATKPADRAMEFIPFGAADKIKLTVEIVQNIIAAPTKTGKTCSQRDAMRFMMLCQAQRLNPFAGDAFLVGYDQKQFDGSYAPQYSLITAHQVFLKRAESSKEFDGMESGIILQVEDGTVTEREGDFSLPGEKVVGGWARVYRKDRKPTYRRLSIEQRIPEYETKFWKGVKASEQIVKCAEADALRSTFPTLLGGMRNENEMGAVINVDMTISPEDKATREMAAQVGALPEQATDRKPADAKLTPQQELEGIVIAEGFTFDQLQKYGTESGTVPEMESFGSFAEVPTEIAKRLVRAKIGLVAGIKKLFPA